MSSNLTTSVCIYAGRRLSTTGTIGYFYEGEDGESLGYKKPLVSGASIGARIEVSSDQPGSYFAGGEHRPRVIGNLPTDDERLLAWAVQERADLTRHARESRSRKIAREGIDPLREQLDPVREQLSRMTGEHRAAAAHWILQYLLTGITR